MVIRYHDGAATSSMSTATAAATAVATPPPEAPWRGLFLEHVGSMASPIFTLSTVRRERQSRARRGEDGGGGSSSSSSSGAAEADITTTPRARTCVFRGMWASLATEADARNTAPQNPAGVFASDLLTLTTDARMDKMAELLGAVVDADDNDDGTHLPCPGSGGGAPVEAVFWPASTGVQWRLRGRAYVLGPDIDDEAGRPTRDAVGRRMRRLQPTTAAAAAAAAPDQEWSWAREVTAHFGNLSPGMRGAFRNPPPGQPVALPVDDEGGRIGLGQRVDDLHDAVARRHFRVVVVVPDEVDRTDLSDPARPRRWVYYYRGVGDDDKEPGKPRYPGGQIDALWEKVEVWP